jgi:TonB-dependent receptor
MSLKCRFLVLFLLTFTVSLSLHALLKSDTGTISGNVKDSTGAVLPGAQIKLQPRNTVVVSTGQGSYVISDVAPGAYTMTVTYLGFTAFTSPVTVVAGQTATINAVLTVSSNSQQVTVHGVLSGDAMALNEQKTSANILNVMTAPTIMSLPNQSVATALGRLPGVTVQINEGEPQYVQIRGTEPRLSNTTIDGVLVPGPDPQVRQVDLWVIPADLVGSVAINKTLSANQDGDAIGGSVDLRVKQATNDHPVFSLESIGGYNPIDTGQESFRDTATGGLRFGRGKRWGAMLAYSYDLNNIGTDDVEPVPTTDPNPATNIDPFFNEIAIQEYFYNHTRWGFGGSLDYKLSEDSDLYVHVLLSNFKDYGQKFTYDILSAYNDGIPADAMPGSITYSTSVRRPNYLISSLAMGGNHVFSHTYLKYQVAVARSRFGAAAGNPGADFSSTTGQDCQYSPSATKSIYRPQFPCGNDPIYDPTQYTLKDINLTTGQSTQINLQANGAYGILYHLGTHASTLEFGGQFRNAHKGQFATSPTYDCQGVDSNGNPIPCGTLPLMSQFTTSFTNPSYYGGSYQFGPITSFDLITKWLATNPGVLPYDSGATHLNSDSADYNLQERISAGYIMNTVELGSRIHLQTGLRIEATNESNTGYLVTLDANGNWVSTTPRHGSASYVDPLPSVQFRYNFDQNSDIRAVYGRGISRPNPYDLIPYATLDTSQIPNAVAIGNPALVAEHANDYDILYEKFLPSVGMFEAGYFYKQLSSPIFSQQKTVPNPFPTGTTPTAIQTQSVNGGHAHVQGIEMAYQQHLTFLPGVLSGARISANYTYTESKSYGVPGRTDVPPLVGQAPVSWNINPSYATKRALFTVGISHDGANIAAYQYQDGNAGGITGPNGDNYYYVRTQLDAQASYYIGKGFTVLASGENMNNAILGFYNGSKQYMTQREYYKPIYSGGLRWESKSMR